ncbi:MAG: hypothetical protein ABUL60_24290 [Myxococcales bacterium]
MDLTPAGFPRCGSLDPSRADDCAGIDLIRPKDPHASSNVDGSIQIGESAPVSVWVENGDSIAHDNVCVGIAVDSPGVTLAPDEETNPVAIGHLYAGAIPIVTPAYFRVGSVKAGTVVRFTAWTTYEGTNCAGPTATVDALVKSFL